MRWDENFSLILCKHMAITGDTNTTLFLYSQQCCIHKSC
uniref:Uncharacterized protein n=1 Tax=Anguilla anguilla TaxID=7936 RepID=A0A0E9R9B6_ANGAN